MSTVDVVLDQLIVGWYAMFAIEAMAMAKPVICHIAPDLLAFYTAAGLLRPGELPLLDASTDDVQALLRRLATGTIDLAAIGGASREFVCRHHSLDAVGKVFARVNSRLGLSPRGEPATDRTDA